MISVIIPCFNGGRLLDTCLTSIAASRRTGELDVLLVDDASPMASGPKPIADRTGLRRLRNDRNLGFVRTANRGAGEAKGDILVFLNQDTEFISPGWDEKLLRIFDRRPKTGIVGGKLVYPDSGLVQFAGGCLDGEEWKTDYLYYRAPPEIEAVNRAREVDWALGAFLAVRRDLFNKLGGFCTDFHSNYEDIDLCLRARELGYRTRYEPNISLYHHETITGLSDIHQGRSLSLFRRKWLERLRRKQPDYYGRDGLDGLSVRRLMRLLGRDFFSVLRVLQDFDLHCPERQRAFAAGDALSLLDRLVNHYAGKGDAAEADFRYYRSRLLMNAGGPARLVGDLRWVTERGLPGRHRDESRLRLMLLGETPAAGGFHSPRLGKLADFIGAVRAGENSAETDPILRDSLLARYLELIGEMLTTMPAGERDCHAAFILERPEAFPNRGALVAVLFRLAYVNHGGLAESLMADAQRVIREAEWDPVKRTQFAVNEASFHERVGDHHRALAVLEAAGGEKTVAPGSLKSSLLFHLASNHAAIGNAAAARRCLRGVLRLTPDHGRARSLLAGLEPGHRFTADAL
jgi:GT2 family glycosyltransferase